MRQIDLYATVKNMPKISIITTTYKHQDFIAQTINSVLDQTVSDWEMLIGDDSPDDKTWEIIQEYVKKYPDKIKARHHKPNKGIVANMNFLLSKVNEDSEYISFLEGDDIYKSNYLGEKFKIFSKHPNVALVYNNLDFIDNKGIIYYKNYLKNTPFYLKGNKLTKKQFLEKDNRYLSYSSIMIKKDILLKEANIHNPTNNKLFSISDWDLFFRISSKYNCYGIENSLTLYRRHSRNLSTSGDSKIIDDLIILADYYRKINFLNEYEYRYLLGRLSYTLGCLAVEKNKKINAFKHLKKSIILSFDYNIIGKILLFIRILLPYKIQTYFVNKLFYAKWK